MEVILTPIDRIKGTNIYASTLVEVKIIKSCGDRELDSYPANIKKEAAELETNSNVIILENNIGIIDFVIHKGNVYGYGNNNKQSNYGDYHNLVVKRPNGQQISNEVLEVCSNHYPNRGFYVKNSYNKN